MKPIALSVAIAALVLAGCGDKDAGSETAGNSLIEKATQAARDTANTASEKAADMADASGDLIEKAKESAGEAMADATDSLKEAASTGTLNTETAMEAAGDATARVVEDAKTAAADKLAAATGSVSTEGAAEQLASATGMTTESATATAAAAAASVAATEPAAGAPAADLALGEKIYKANCFACHGTGAAGAPKLGDAAAWTDRLARGDATLIKHAIEGFKGNTGYMPPKGGFSNLSDDEVAAAVHYMVAQSK